jgi:hypothetical protein
MPITYKGLLFTSGVIANQDGNVLINLMKDDTIAVRFSATDGENSVALLCTVHMPYHVEADTIRRDGDVSTCAMAAAAALATDIPQGVKDALDTFLAAVTTPPAE